MSKLEKYFFYGFFTLLLILVFFRLGQHDMLHDDGHYALRSLGYFDYVASLQQTTPVQWFGYRPWWSYLSFHDHPPLFFLIQHIFFKLFGASVIVSRLPSAFAALGSAVLVFLLGKKSLGNKAALFSLAALSVNSYFVWMGRVGYIEGVFTFFLLLSFWFLVKALQENQRYFWKAGLFFGLTFLTKYTLLPILPAVLLYLIWKERWVFRNKKFWWGIVIFLVVCLPVIVYNLKMYQTRGHFDVQFSDLFKQKHNDWPKLTNRVATAGANPLAVAQVLVQGFSWPYSILLIGGLIGSVFAVKRSKNSLAYLFILVFIFLITFFSFIGATDRWLSVLSPFAALLLGIGLERFFTNRYALAGFVIIGLFSLFYTLNTNNLRKSIFGKFWVSQLRLENYGYNQLDKNVTALLNDKRSPGDIQALVDAAWYSELRPEAINFSDLKKGQKDLRALIVFDSNSLWFATVWTFERWKLYRRFFTANTEEFLLLNKSEKGREVLSSLSPIKIYFIESGTEVKSSADTKFPESQQLVDIFRKEDPHPKIILDDQGREAFRIYEGTLNP